MTRVGRVFEMVVGPAHGGRFAALDGYRGLAALGVLIFHVQTATMFRPDARGDVIDNLGNFGVAVFFLLSGFLLYRPFSEAMVARSGVSMQRRPRVGRFLLRRFLRIYPAYWLALVGWALVATDTERDAVRPIRAFLLIGNGLAGLGVAWSLYIEVSFYVFVAVVGAGLCLVTRKARAGVALLIQIIVLVMMTVGAYVFRLTLVLGPDGDRMRGLMLPNYLDWFALGMLLAALSVWRDAGYRLPRSLTGLADRAWACFVLAALSYAVVVLPMEKVLWGGSPEPPVVYVSRFLFQGLAAFFVLLPAVLGSKDQRSLRVLASAPLAALGTISYGVYLWHTVLIEAVGMKLSRETSYLDLVGNIALIAALTIVAATLSYRLLERPALRVAEPSRHRRRRSGRRSRYLERLDRVAPSGSHGLAGG